jgi:hypothetical protein
VSNDEPQRLAVAEDPSPVKENHTPGELFVPQPMASKSPPLPVVFPVIVCPQVMGVAPAQRSDCAETVV